MEFKTSLLLPYHPTKSGKSGALKAVFSALFGVRFIIIIGAPAVLRGIWWHFEVFLPSSIGHTANQKHVLSWHGMDGDCMLRLDHPGSAQRTKERFLPLLPAIAGWLPVLRSMGLEYKRGALPISLIPTTVCV